MRLEFQRPAVTAWKWALKLLSAGRAKKHLRRLAR
jgi:hypothetical protein